jgi:glutamate dehydrogenase/leucine dehydrogenase
MTFDELGPLKIEEHYFPSLGLKAYVVVDNTALGPSIGGVRVSPNVTIEEIARLARTMTLKNSIAGLPHGGGKAGIVADPKDERIETFFRAFARRIKSLEEYIPGPDMGSNEESMAWIYDEIGRAVGLPEELGGLSLDKLGATGYGLSECADIALSFRGLSLKGVRVAIQGFGSVGKAVARFLSEKGAIIIAVSDTKGTIYAPEGLMVKELMEVKKTTGSVVNYNRGERLSAEEILSIECDILIPAANPDVITMKNVGAVKAKIILEGANIPVSLDAEEVLYEKGILVVPDFIANAGGVIMAWMEYNHRTQEEAFNAIRDKIRKNTGLILERSLKEKVSPRKAAVAIAKERILSAMRYRLMAK